MREVRLIDKDSNQLGVVPVAEALKISRESKLDLVEVAPQAVPPVCRIMDYGKYMYQQSKRERETKKKHKTMEVKEIRMRPSIGEHDYQVKLRQAEKFLGRGDKVKVTVRFRGREMGHTDIGRKLLEKFARDVEPLSKIEREPRIERRDMIMILNSK